MTSSEKYLLLYTLHRQKETHFCYVSKQICNTKKGCPPYPKARRTALSNQADTAGVLHTKTPQRRLHAAILSSPFQGEAGLPSENSASKGKAPAFLREPCARLGGTLLRRAGAISYALPLDIFARKRGESSPLPYFKEALINSALPSWHIFSALSSSTNPPHSLCYASGLSP